MDFFKNFFNQIFLYNESTPIHSFTLPKENNNNYSKVDNIPYSKIYPSLDVNIDYIKTKYSLNINSDIIVRSFNLVIKGKEYKACIVFIDGMVDSELINNFILRPLMNNSTNTSSKIISSAVTNNITVKKVKKFNLENYIYNSLIPQNNISKIKNFEKLLSNINSGECGIIIDTLNTAFSLDVKGYASRNISSPQNEIVVRGSQEAFVEKLRTNTSILRRLVNNENLIIENSIIGKLSKTKIAICYMKNIANSKLIEEVKYRINNLSVDSIISSGQLEQLIQDNGLSIFPQIIATERPDKATNHLLEGRVVVLVNGSPYSLIMPGVLVDFLSSPEDINLKFRYANLLKFIRILAFIITLFLPSAYIAVTTFHTELIPTELLFTIAASRNTIPFPIIFEIFLMEISFELIREARSKSTHSNRSNYRYCWCFNTSEKQQ